MTTNNHSRPELRLADQDSPGPTDTSIPATLFNNGRFTRAAIHCEAGELELKLNPHGNWQLKLRAEGDRDWRLACSGDLTGGDIVPPEPETAALRFGRLLLDRDARRVLVEGSEVKLSARQYELLEALSIHPERVIARPIWPAGPGVGSRWGRTAPSISTPAAPAPPSAAPAPRAS